MLSFNHVTVFLFAVIPPIPLLAPAAAFLMLCIKMDCALSEAASSYFSVSLRKF
jgi:hypothetical protein